MKSSAGIDRVLVFRLPKEIRKSSRPIKPKPTPAARRKSSDSNITTPARRMRIIYEFTKQYVIKSLLPLGLDAGIKLYFEIEACKVIQRVVRIWLSRKMIRLLRHLRRLNASIIIQKEGRRMLAILKLWRLRRERDRGIRNRCAVVLECFGRVIIAREKAKRMKEKEKMTFFRACLRVQTCARKVKQYKIFKKKRKSAVRIQAIIR